MDHNDAVDQYAAEQYLLGELSESDTEAFEAHMVDCAACVEQVQLGIEILSAGRKCLQESKQKLDSRVESARRRFCRVLARRKQR